MGMGVVRRRRDLPAGFPYRRDLRPAELRAAACRRLFRFRRRAAFAGAAMPVDVGFVLDDARFCGLWMAMAARGGWFR
jgi:hypothetical protein